MSIRPKLVAVVAVLAAMDAAGAGAAAASAAPTTSGEGQARMRMDEPMPEGMMKPGMKKGDVRQAAQKKEQAMKPMLDQEQTMMPSAGSKP